MINAEQARKMAREANECRLVEQTKNAEEQIRAAAEKGHTYCYIDGILDFKIRNYFESLGFRVNTQSALNETWTTITWEEED